VSIPRLAVPGNVRPNPSTEDFIHGSEKPPRPRLSIPFFQHVTLLTPKDLSVDIPSHITSLIKNKKVVSDAEFFFSGPFDGCVGDTVFVNMLTS
jgi:hypothetical protein